jgi:hypothetical protein
MSRLYFLVLCVVGLTSCVKEEAINQKTFPDAEEIKITEVQTGKDEPVKDPLEGKSVQEIIQEYDNTVVLQVAMEGNFTNSGSREIVGFYQDKVKRTDHAIDAVYCFVLNTDETKVEHIYPVDYWTLGLTARHEANTGLSSVLGRDIIWLDRRIGCIGDFNGNGKEELYLFRLGMGMLPFFFEFDQNSDGFVDILNCDTNNNTLVIKDIDAEEKVIFLEEVPGGKMSLPDQYWYKWDENSQRYTVLKEALYPYVFDDFTITMFNSYPKTIMDFKKKYQEEILEERIGTAESGSSNGTKAYTFVLKGRQFIFHGETEEEAKIWKLRIEDVSAQDSNVRIIGMNVDDLKRLINLSMDYEESRTDESKLEIVVNNQYSEDYYLIIGTGNGTVLWYDLVHKE